MLPFQLKCIDITPPSGWIFVCDFSADGSLSDTALNSSLLDCQLPDRTTSSWRRGASSSASSSGGLAHSSSASQPQQLYAKNSDKGGLSKKSNSTSQLSATGQFDRFHFFRLSRYFLDSRSGRPVSLGQIHFQVLTFSDI